MNVRDAQRAWNSCVEDPNAIGDGQQSVSAGDVRVPRRIGNPNPVKREVSKAVILPVEELDETQIAVAPADRRYRVIPITTRASAVNQNV